MLRTSLILSSVYFHDNTSHAFMDGCNKIINKITIIVKDV